MKSRAETCRKKAAECERAAARVGDPQIQASYREMSRQFAVRPIFGPLAVRFFRLAHDAGLAAPS